MNIRSATPDDIPVIQKLVHTIWPIAYSNIISAEQITYMLDLIYSETALQKQFADGHRFIIADENESPVGFASYSVKNPADRAHYRLHKLYVLPDLHRKGTGKMLLNYIIHTIKSEGATSIELNVNRDNKAIDFYKYFGFDVTKSEDIDIGRGYFMNDFVMVKEIESSEL